MLKKTLLVTGLLLSADAFADWSARINHFSIRDNVLLDLSDSHSAITLGGGYKHGFAEQFYAAANAFHGISFDSDGGLFSGSDKTELNKLHGAELRVGYYVNSEFSLFTGVQYVKQEYQIHYENSGTEIYSRSDTDLLLGLDYEIFRDITLDAVYAKKGSGQSLSLGITFQF